MRGQRISIHRPLTAGRCTAAVAAARTAAAAGRICARDRSRCAETVDAEACVHLVIITRGAARARTHASAEKGVGTEHAECGHSTRLALYIPAHGLRHARRAPHTVPGARNAAPARTNVDRLECCRQGYERMAPCTTASLHACSTSFLMQDRSQMVRASKAPAARAGLTRPQRVLPGEGLLDNSEGRKRRTKAFVSIALLL